MMKKKLKPNFFIRHLKLEKRSFSNRCRPVGDTLYSHLFTAVTTTSRVSVGLAVLDQGGFLVLSAFCENMHLALYLSGRSSAT